MDLTQGLGPSGPAKRRQPHQARALLDAGHAQQPSGPRLVAFFAVMYYAGLRPEEATNLSADNVLMPPRIWDAESHQWQDPAGLPGLGRAAPPRCYAGCGQRMDRRRQPSGTQAAQAPGRGRHPHRAHPSRADQDPPLPPSELRLGRRWPSLRRCAGRRTAHHYLPPHLDQGTPAGPNPSRASLSPSPAAIRPCGTPACLRG